MPSISRVYKLCKTTFKSRCLEIREVRVQWPRLVSSPLPEIPAKPRREKILGYLRNFGILDGADCERVSSETISDHMVTELVTMIHTKDPHAFWYFAHSLKTNALFKFFHGEVHCCGKSVVVSRMNDIGTKWC